MPNSASGSLLNTNGSKIRPEARRNPLKTQDQATAEPCNLLKGLRAGKLDWKKMPHHYFNDLASRGSEACKSTGRESCCCTKEPIPSDGADTGAGRNAEN